MPVDIKSYVEMVKSFLNPEKWLFEIKPKTEEKPKQTE
jgi:hypothetical protein